ncbi:hypothetical protein Sjap_021650 [Stephania japonica]|uniref:Uncharacterized protein n=1 Tax=Stephania japonica TaxID=461633 RepID=A0AAP0ET18_9MAGN
MTEKPPFLIMTPIESNIDVPVITFNNRKYSIGKRPLKLLDERSMMCSRRKELLG